MKIILPLAAVLVLVCHAACAATGTVTLVWTASPDPNVVTYHIYEGVSTRVYTNIISVGNVTQTTVANLVIGQPYFFTATALTSAGLESQFSNEVTYTSPPPVLPIITSQPASSTNDYGSSVTLSVVATGSGLTYQWFKNGASIPGAITASLSLTGLTWVNNGSYNCMVANAAGSVNTTNAVVSVRPPAPTNFRAVGP